MASMSIKEEPSYTSSCWKYDVFLSFRGEDMRKKFIDHLYAALNQRGIHVFRDDKELERGNKISLGLLQAIEQSRFSIIVFSKNYASSTWCLFELVKIVECMKSIGQTVIPVFYDVDPSVVRKQTGDFQKAFTEHEETFRENLERVQTWRSALTEVANLCGLDARDRYEQELIHEIVEEVSSKLSLSTSMSLKNLVGIDSRLEKLKMLIGARHDDVRMIGICGMGGIGKTTIARVAYEMISCEFEKSSFLANVREISKKDGLFSLQKILLSQILDMKKDDINVYNEYDGMGMIRSRLRCKKVFVVIDDVDDSEQLNKLAGEHNWFGPGSRIIITSRIKNMLTSHGVDEIYEAEILNDDEALQLLILKAFKKKQPSENFRELSNCIVTYASGLPLALEVLGSFLSGREVHIWGEALNRLNRYSEKKILDTLQISFDGLEESEKKIFLDIACFFKGESRSNVTKILESCEFFPNIGIDVLIDKSLLTILHDDTLWMHDLLQEMGQQIIKRECLEEPGKRSRLWDEVDVRHVLLENTGTDLIEGLVIEKNADLVASAKAFSKMINLRLLKIHNVQLPEGLECLSNKLRLLKWHGYPLKSLPSSFQPDKIVELHMHCSRIEQLWKGIKPLNKLTFICLKDCPNLREVPDLTWAPNLEKLLLHGCPMLRGFHSPLIVHEKLIYLEVSDCTNLTTLPYKIHMESLETIKIFKCPKVKRFPEVVRSMERLRYFCADGIAIKDMPSRLEFLNGLEHLILRNNSNLMTLPSTINNLKNLQTLDLSGCPKLVKLPMINGLKSLQTLDLSGCSNLASLPSSINDLECLKSLSLAGCSKLENTLQTLGQIESLENLDLNGCSIIFMKNLKDPSFRGCGRPTSKTLSWHFLCNFIPRRHLAPTALMLPSLSSLRSLRTLNLGGCHIREGAIPCDLFANLLSLKTLNLSKNDFVSLPASIKCIPKLERFYLNDCKRLQSLAEFPASVDELMVEGCVSLEIFPESNNTQHFISFVNCHKLFGGNHLMFAMLKAFLKARQNPKDYFNMVVPGSKIPEWLRHQNEGHSITIDRPPNLCNNKLVGFIVCSSFSIYMHSPVHYNDKSPAYPLHIFGSHQLACNVLIDGRTCGGFYVSLKEKLGRAVSGHVWLLYLPYEMYFSYDEPEDKYSHIGFLFKEESGPGLEVKSCGVHLIYQQDVEKFIQMIKQSSDFTSRDLKEFTPDCMGSTVDVTTSKRSLTDHDDQELQPKIFKKFRLF